MAGQNAPYCIVQFLGSSSNYISKRTRIDTLVRETGVRILTYDSILRNKELGLSFPKHVLRKDGLGFRFKTVGDCETSIFSCVNAEFLHLSDLEKKLFINQGYDINSWEKGELLVVNDKYPKSRSEEIFGRVLERIKTGNQKSSD